MLQVRPTKACDPLHTCVLRAHAVRRYVEFLENRLANLESIIREVHLALVCHPLADHFGSTQCTETCPGPAQQTPITT